MKGMGRIFSNGLIVGFLLLLLQAPQVVNAQVSVDWVTQTGSAANDFQRDTVLSADNHLYSVGQTSGALPGNSTFGQQDAYLIKYDSSGGVVWIRQFGTAGFDDGWSVAIDGSGFIYVSGTTTGTLPSADNSGSGEVFLRKYNNSGAEIWTRQFGGFDASSSKNKGEGYVVSADSSGNIYVAGTTSGIFTGQTSSGGNDAYLAKYDNNGNFIWARQFGSSVNDSYYGMSLDSLGDVVLTGFTAGSLPGHSSSGNHDLFIAKVNSAGTTVWTQQLGTDKSDEAYDVTIDSLGDIIVGGKTDGSFPGNTSLGKSDGAFIKLTPTGSVTFYKQFGTPEHDLVRAITTSPDGSILTAGQTDGTFPGNTNPGGTDVFISHNDSNGVEVEIFQFGTSGTDANGFRNRMVFSNNSVYFSGLTDGTFQGQTNSGGFDGFTVKLSIPPSNLPPTADAGPDQLGAIEGANVFFDGSGSDDPDGVSDIVSYDWEFGDGEVGSGVSPIHSYDDNGIYVATLTVEDAAGETDQDTITITVNNATPIVGTISASGTSFILGNSTFVTTNGSFTDTGILDTHTALWDFGEGTSVGNVTQASGSGTVDGSFTYTVAGSYNVSLTVTDDDGDFGLSSNTITIDVLTPLDAIQDLIDLTESLNLQNGIENNLDAKLDAAVNALDDLNNNNDQAAINSLNAFINAVDAQRGNQISNAEADQLIAAAQAIIDALTA
jgi:PKD repeat protein